MARRAARFVTMAPPAAPPVAGAPERSAALVAAMIDPVSRFYRYPLVRRVLPWVMPTAVTPTQITALHTLFGLAAAGAVLGGTPSALLLAAVCWELHLVLDCLDGALARARGTTSDRGRTLDILGDTVAYIALAAAMAVHLRTVAPAVPARGLAVALIASGAIAAWAHDFYLRKFTAALTGGTDLVHDQLLAKQRVIRTGGAGFIAWFGYLFEWWQIVWLDPGSARGLWRRLREENPAAGISPGTLGVASNVDTPAARRAFRAVSLMSNDINVTIVGVGLLTRQLVVAQLMAIAWACATLLVGIAACRAFLAEARRRAAT